jgi:hypothetical protein
MDVPETKDWNGCEPILKPKQPNSKKSALDGDLFDVNTWRRFFHVTGGSLLYCLSAVFTVYGIVKLMRPILAKSETISDALPCILTLHAYELALLGVLILIVSKKIIDDAVSIAILIALFLVGTSMALGSVADKNIGTSFWVGVFGIAVTLGKLYAMRRFARIPFRTLSVLGAGILITCNYIGPTLLARLISVSPSQEASRRELWLLIYLAMLIGAGFVFIEALRNKTHKQEEQSSQNCFLQSPLMVYVFAFVLLFGSGIHQYSTAFTFALERVLGDFVPITLVGTLLLLEILRFSGRRFGALDILISCTPLGMMLLAIMAKSVLATGQAGLGLMCYPPVILALSGLAIAGVALYHKQRLFIAVAILYGLGVILTLGFSPEHPHDLNFHICFGILVLAILVYGIVLWNQYICLSGIAILCLGASLWDSFSTFTASHHLTEVGGLAGICGLGAMGLYLLFGQKLLRVIRILGVFAFSVFVFDYLPDSMHWRYLIVLVGTGLIMSGVWLRTKDLFVISVPCIPFLARLFEVGRQIANWRFVILGFLLLGAGTVVSLLKGSKKVWADPENKT